METDSLLSDLESSGWLEDLSSEIANSLRSKLADCERGEVCQQLASFTVEDPDLFGGAGSLMEIPPSGSIASYDDLLKAYTDASEGHFAPEAIVEEADEDGGCFTIGFLASNRIHALFIPGPPQFDIEINDLVNASLSSSGTEKRFLVLPTSDNGVAIAFVTPAAFERACQLGVIPLQEELLSELYEDPLGPAESARPKSLALHADYDLLPA